MGHLTDISNLQMYACVCVCKDVYVCVCVCVSLANKTNSMAMATVLMIRKTFAWATPFLPS